MRFEEQVYQSLCGNLARPINGAESLYYPGSKCETAWESMALAYERLLIRLGGEDEDKDIEEIISALLTIQQEMAMKMFECGREYEKAL